MKSNKQRHTEIRSHRKKRASKAAVPEPKDPCQIALTNGMAPCNPLQLAPFNSYGVPPFVARGYYVDLVFQCIDCQKEEIWRATQQKWWYEVAKGNVESCATRCQVCRRIERERRNEARRVHLEGIAKKHPPQ